MGQKPTDAMRQILMNELGLTRESVRDEMRTIVRAEASKLVESLDLKQAVNRIVSEKFEAIVRGNKWSNRDQVSEIVLDEAKKQIATFIAKRVRITPITEE